MVALGSKMAPPKSIIGSNHRNTWKIFNNLFLQNHLPLVLEFRYVAMPSSPFGSNQGPGVQNGPSPGAPRFEL